MAVIGFLLLGAQRRGLASPPDTTIAEILASRTQERLSRTVSLARWMTGNALRVYDEAPSWSLSSRRLDSHLWRICGFGSVARFSAAPRATRLPVDPIFVLGESYLKCDLITAALLEPTVSVESYPPGYFGGYEYDGLLPSDRFEFTDEATLGKIFKLLVESVKVPGNEEMIEEFLDDEMEPELKLTDYRRSTGFVPEYVFDFVGEKPLRVEINLTKGRMLIQAGEKWDGYEIDSRSAWALRSLLVAQRKGA